MKKTLLAVVFILTLTLNLSGKAWGYAIATSSVWATEAAAEILKKGGNATDAMIAASFVGNVVQPYKLGIGGGGFYVIHTRGKAYVLNSRETAPASATPTMFLNRGKPIPYWPDRVTGPNPVGVPGMVAGLVEAHKRWGKLPWKQLLQPAIRLAKEGFPITRKFEEELAENWERMSVFPATAATYGNGEGSYLKTGRMLRQPLLAQTFEKIAASPQSFYKGDLARSWITEAQKMGVKITEKDLADYKVREDKPVQYSVFGLQAFTAAPPSSSGIMVGAVLRFLEQYYARRALPAPDSPQRMTVTSETIAYFQALRNEKMADAPDGKLDPAKFLGSAEEKKAWTEIEKNIQGKMDRLGTRVGQLENVLPVLAKADPNWKKGHTAHLSVVDNNGMAVSYTTTIEELFGSGIVVPKHGFLLNNELSDFTAEPEGHPNAPRPGKRPRSNMSPTVLVDHGVPVAAVGCAGGQRIPTAVAQFLENYYVFKMGAREALAFPRFHPNGEKLEVEHGFPKASLEQLKEAGYEIEEQPTLWTAAEMLIRRSPKSKWEAAFDPRYDGMTWMD